MVLVRFGMILGIPKIGCWYGSGKLLVRLCYGHGKVLVWSASLSFL